MGYDNMLERFPLRVALTDHCNLDCSFCSNEGMLRKASAHAQYGEMAQAIRMMGQAGLRQLSITGGDPTTHPALNSIIDAASGIPIVYLHTNGVYISQGTFDRLHRISKMAVSFHAAEYGTWARITGGTRHQYDRRAANLERLAGHGADVELKHVPVRGINATQEHLAATLDTCAQYGFRFKFLELEAAGTHGPEDIVSKQDIEQGIIRLGCVPTAQASFRGQDAYIPISRFAYKGTAGVVARIGCGDDETCAHCSETNEIFLTPELQLKPCRRSPYTIDIREHVLRNDAQGLAAALVASRRFLEARR